MVVGLLHSRHNMRTRKTDNGQQTIRHQDPRRLLLGDRHDCNSRSSVEMNDPSSRPAIKGMPEDIAGYDTIFIGYPIWWGLAPRIVNTFIESLGGDKKTIIPFATSGGSGITGSVSALKSAYPGHDWKEGRLLNTTDRNTVRSWTDSLGL